MAEKSANPGPLADGSGAEDDARARERVHSIPAPRRVQPDPAAGRLTAKLPSAFAAFASAIAARPRRRRPWREFP
jgi:hypothetical protein